MKIRLFLLLAITWPLYSFSQTVNPSAEGYLLRAQEMLRDKNYTGVRQQIEQLSAFNPTEAQKAEALRLSAIASMHLPHQTDVLQLINSWLDNYPESIYYTEMLALKGDYYFFEGDYSSAIDIYSGINTDLLDSSTSADLTYRLAYSKMMLGESQTARLLFQQLENNRSWSKAAYFYLGYLAYADGDYKTALTYFPKASSDNELGIAADYYTLQIYFMQGYYEQALTMSQKLLKSNDIAEYYGEACRIAGESLFNLGNEDAALPYLRKYMATTSNPLPSACYILGIGEYKSGNYLQAVTYLSKASNQNNAMGQSANLYLGQSYVNLDKMDAALMCFEKAYSMGYDRQVAESALYNYAVAKNDGGRMPFANSVGLFEDFLKQYPDSKYAADVREYMVNGYMSDNDYAQALRIIDSTRNPNADLIRAKQQCLYVLGTREYASGNLTSALTRFRQASSITSGEKDLAQQSLLWQGICQYDLKDYDSAVKSFVAYIQKAGKRDPNLALARYDLGYARFELHDYKAALTEFRSVIDLKPEKIMLADAYNRAGDCLYYQSDFKGAESYYDKAMEIDPSSGDYAIFQQATIRGLQRDYKGKITQLDDLISRYPHSQLIPAAILGKAESYLSIGDNRNAIAIYNSLLSQYASTPYGRKGALQLAIAYTAAGNESDAIDTYKYVITTYPTSEEAKIATDALKNIYATTGKLNEFREFIAMIPDAPEIDPSEIDALAFRSAEADYINKGSVTLLKRYVDDNPQGIYLPQALYLMAEAANNNGDKEQALSLSKQVAQRYPDADVASLALLIEATIEEETDNLDDALNSYMTLENKTFGTRLQNQATTGVARTAASLGKYNDALAASERALSNPSTSSPEISFIHAESLYNLGRKNEAIVEWEQLAEDPTSLYGAKAAISLGEAFISQGHYAEAQKVADNLINANPPYHYWLARGFIVLSDALRGQGEEFEADEYLLSLKKNYPGSETDIFKMIDNRLK